MAQRTFIRSSVTIVAVLIALLCGLWFWKRSIHRQTVQRPSAEHGNGTAQTQDRIPTTNARQPDPSITLPADPVEKRRLAVDAKNVPVNFWGKVVDQDDAPLQEVRISARIRRWNMGPSLNPGGVFTTKAAVSRNDGSLEITGASGDVLTIVRMEEYGDDGEVDAL